MSTRTFITVFAAAAVGTAGFLGVQAPAQAQPGTPFPLAPGDCLTYGWPGDFQIIQSKGFVYSLSGTGKDAAGLTMTTLPPHVAIIMAPGTQLDGTLTVDGKRVTGRFTLKGSTEEQLYFQGTVGSDGIASGTESVSGATWKTNTALTCDVAEPAADSQTADTGPSPGGAGSPAVSNSPPIDSVRLTFEPGAPFKVNAVFENTSNVTGRCHYDAQGVDGAPGGKTDDFSIGKKETVTREYPAPLPDTTYHVTLSCSGSVDASPTQFGNIDKDFNF